MTQVDALAIVLSLACDNSLDEQTDDYALQDEAYKQQVAIAIVRMMLNAMKRRQK